MFVIVILVIINFIGGFLLASCERFVLFVIILLTGVLYAIAGGNHIITPASFNSWYKQLFIKLILFDY